MLEVAVEGVFGMGGTPVVVEEGIWLRCLGGMANWCKNEVSIGSWDS